MHCEKSPSMVFPEDSTSGCCMLLHLGKLLSLEGEILLVDV